MNRDQSISPGWEGAASPETHITHLPVRRFRIWAIVIACLTGLSCAGAQAPQPDSLRFALTGSTHPESPFTGRNEALPALFIKINADNPVFVVHLGDIILGGKEWMGITEKDLDRQFRDFRQYAYALNPVLFTVKGEKDLLNTSADNYHRHTGRKAWYSFNYGNCHFIVLDTCDPSPCAMGDAQKKWLAADLKRYRRHPAIFVFTHHPPELSGRTKGDTGDDPDTCPSLAGLHDLFKEYPVRAVISGHRQVFLEEKKDKILYVTAGCEFAGRAGKAQPRRRDANQYYLVDFTGGEITVHPGRID